ncbi:protocatechuate 3,4-dioxygenase beta subunit [Noviherbaspirillum humi]|uniref:Protocatechuate 3,4-dioxygenase beta subunit n=1 Tax=Noviherbaspirillum humi TaxID=1688639 RepID=A0A239I0Z0_9BURK|nr:protocatechuate 3,4-dioxygenase [Noviherbaspirillum humi]SNS87496.1 protocatechuate 3,4-dioxygenase beta subunit [Noviherbaspirillum humi]
MPDFRSTSCHFDTSPLSCRQEINRRRMLLRSLGAGIIAFHPWRALAAELVPTPAQTEGPFYPDRLPLDQDNDLLVIAGRNAAAAGEVTQLAGRVLDIGGRPLRGVTVEIWQVDRNGRYIHSADADARNDANFQGFGRFETDADGAYRFRTIKPVPYPGRAPHIHVKLHRSGRELLTTQLYVQGHPQNERDGVLRAIRDARQRASVLVPFVPSDVHPGELSARFDIVLGTTPRG